MPVIENVFSDVTNGLEVPLNCARHLVMGVCDCFLKIPYLVISKQNKKKIRKGKKSLEK